MAIYAGLDVHSKQTSYCVQNRGGRILWQGSIETTEAAVADLLIKIRAPRGTKIALETGAQAKWMARLLAAAGMEPLVVDAHEVRAKSPRRGQKTDTRDAFEICDGLRRDQWTKIVWIPPASIETLRQTLSRRRHFIKIRTSQVNAAKFLVRSLGIRLTAKTLTTDAAWQKLIARQDLKPIAHWLQMHHKLWTQAQQNVTQLDTDLAQALDQFKQPVEQMTTVFGVGPITAASLIAALGDPHRFADSNKVISYLGCAPGTYDSGGKQRHTAITRLNIIHKPTTTTKHSYYQIKDTPTHA